MEPRRTSDLERTEEDPSVFGRPTRQGDSGIADGPEGSEAELSAWEYKVILGGAGAREAAERLNALGVDGWELVGVEPPPPTGQTILYLKRPMTG